MTFAIITPALIAGAFAERMKFSAMLWFIGLWAICVYAPIAHWVWGPDGLLLQRQHRRLGEGARLRRRHRGACQFRHCRPDVRARASASARTAAPPHNMVLTFIGAALLWVGWFGFNAGSAVTAGLQAGMAMTVTQIATAVGGVDLDVRRMGDARQADRGRHLHRRGGGSRRHHAGLGLRRAGGFDLHRHRRRHRLLLGLHRAQAHVRL